MDDKRFYWIKLKTDFFDQEKIDFLMSQENGCEYIVLYQMLCLKTANSNGEMSTHIGEMIVPYDVKKIVRDTKYFDTDTVVVALELFKRLGLVYSDEGGMLRIADLPAMVGSESANANAQRQKRFRDKQRQKALTESVTESNADCVTENNEEYRDKSIEIRDKSKKKDASAKKFEPPTIEEARAFFIEKGFKSNPDEFYWHYETCGWTQNNGKLIKSWRAAANMWETRDRKWNSGKKQPTKRDDPQREMTNVDKQNQQAIADFFSLAE